MIKRLFDLIAAAVGLVLLAPVMAVIGILVKRDSEGPALFKQERIGRGGEPFTLLKFRSMTAAPVSSGSTDYGGHRYAHHQTRLEAAGHQTR